MGLREHLGRLTAKMLCEYSPRSSSYPIRKKGPLFQTDTENKLAELAVRTSSKNRNREFHQWEMSLNALWPHRTLEV